MSDEISSHQLTRKDFQYMDEASIHNELRCSICFQCFIKPVCSSNLCNHTFCDECIHELLKTDDKCPMCRRPISEYDFKVVDSRVVINMLDQLLVQCSHCDTTNIPRGDMITHLQHCDKFIISCSEANLGCSWTGQRIDLADHLKACVHHQIQPLIERLYAEVDRLQEQVNDLKAQQEHLETQIETQSKDGTRLYRTLKTKNQGFQARSHLNINEPTTMARRHDSPRSRLPHICGFSYPSPTPLASTFRGPLLLSRVHSPPTPYPYSPQHTPPPPVMPRLPPLRTRMPLTNRQKRGKNVNHRSIIRRNPN